MIDDDDVEDYELVAGVRGQPKYTLLWLGERWSAPHPGSHYDDNLKMLVRSLFACVLDSNLV